MGKLSFLRGRVVKTTAKRKIKYIGDNGLTLFDEDWSETRKGLFGRETVEESFTKAELDEDCRINGTNIKDIDKKAQKGSLGFGG